MIASGSSMERQSRAVRQQKLQQKLQQNQQQQRTQKVHLDREPVGLRVGFQGQNKARGQGHRARDPAFEREYQLTPNVCTK